MSRSERDAVVEGDAHSLLFGGDDDDLHGDEPGEHGEPGPRLSRSEQRRQRAEYDRSNRHRRRRRGILVLGVLMVVVVAGAVWFVARPLYNDRYHPKDYAGAGTGTVVVKVGDGDDASDIGHTLVDAGVVQSVRAFTNQAAKNSQAKLIQPGSYQLRKHMSASNALSLLLQPASKISARLVVPEGATSVQIIPALASALRVSTAAVKATLTDTAQLGLPSTYTVGSAAPSSAEGFLYPATYSFDPGTSPADAVSQMINAFIEQDRSSGFAADAEALKITPYQALIVASIAQSEAKFPDDMAKVARVILNRLAQSKPLQIDATSAYGAKLLGLDPTKVIYADLDSPYNSYTHPGLPPTPISNPGADALGAAAKPAAGDWLYYVNADAAGHLFFTNSETAFAAATKTCYDNKWGCGAP